MTRAYAHDVRIVKFYRTLGLSLLGYIGIVEKPLITPVNIGPSARFFPPLISFLLISSITATYKIEKRIPTPLTASSSLFLFDLVRGKSHFEATTESRQRRDTRPNSFQLLPQLHPNPILRLGPRLALGEPRRRRDLAVRHVLPVGFRSDTGAVHERARTNLSRAGQGLYSDTDEAVVVFTVEFAVAEARSEQGLAIDWVPTNYMQIVFLAG